MTKRVLYIEYSHPAPHPITGHGANVLREHGWEVWFLAKQAGGMAAQFIFDPIFRDRFIEWKHYEPGFRQKLHFLAFNVYCVYLARKLRVQWVYGNDFRIGPGALVISWFLRTKVLYHEHDLPPREDEHGHFSRVLMKFRKLLARRANVLVTCHEERSRELLEDVGFFRPTLEVLNCCRRNEIRQKRIDPVGAELRILFHGSIVPERLPLTLIDAIALVRGKCRLLIAGYTTDRKSDYLAEIKRRATELGISSSIDIVGAIPYRNRLLDLISTCDVGLSFVSKNSSDRNLKSMAGPSQKSFDYLAAGVPLLVTNLPDWNSMFVDPGYALNCNPEDPGSIAEQLQWFHDNPDKLRAMGEKGRQRILGEWNYEKQFEPILEELERSLVC